MGQTTKQEVIDLWKSRFEAASAENQRLDEINAALLAALKAAHDVMLRSAEMHDDCETCQEPIVYSEDDHGDRVYVFPLIEAAIRRAQ